MKKIFIIIFILIPGILVSQTIDQKFHIQSCSHIDSTVSFRGIFAVNASSSWVSGSKGSVYRTSNGGNSWKKLGVPESAELDFRDIHVFSEDTILLMSAGAGGQSKIFKSANRGKTWKTTFVNPHPDGFLNSIAFWNNQNGIAVGDPVDGYLYVITTSDGGDSWQEIDTKNMPPAKPGEFGFAASGTCVSMFGDRFAWIGTGGLLARIFKTTDKGRTWSAVVTPIMSGNNSSGIFTVYFRDRNNGFVAGGNYTKPAEVNRTMAETKDGGEIWQLIEAQNLPYQSCIGELDVDHQPVYISTGPTGTFGSSNGTEWEKISPDGFHCLSSSVDKKIIWLAGSNGRVATLTKIK